MIIPSAIYAIITIFLAFVDYLRIKHAQGKEQNINHGVSGILDITAMAGVSIWYLDHPYADFWQLVAKAFILALGYCAIRLLVYDLTLALMRGLPYNYESATTSSYIDNHSRPIPWWDKRIIAAVIWIVLLIAYHLIFKTW
jgi:hypothetical protein